MDPAVAAEQMWASVNASDLPDEHPEYGKDHLRWMIEQVALRKITGEKAHRWIGWIQGCVCVGNGATLEEMKLINKKA